VRETCQSKGARQARNRCQARSSMSDHKPECGFFSGRVKALAGNLASLTKTPLTRIFGLR
jgi:hypothetical protein